MFDLNTMRTDQSLEQEGAWVDLGDNARIKVARIGNDNYAKDLAARTKPHRQSIRNQTLPESVYSKLLTETMAATILLDWDGIQDNGKTLDYSYDNAILVLTELPDFRVMVHDMASDASRYRLELMEDAQKN